MAERLDPWGGFYQNLIDAGCSQATAQQCVALARGEKRPIYCGFFPIIERLCWMLCMQTRKGLIASIICFIESAKRARIEDKCFCSKKPFTFPIATPGVHRGWQ